MTQQVVMFSFDAERIRLVKELHPALFCVWLLGREMETATIDGLFTRLEDLGGDAYGIPYTHASADLLKATRKRHCPVFVWTVPPGPEVERLASLGANFIITDWPSEVIQQLAPSDRGRRKPSTD